MQSTRLRMTACQSVWRARSDVNPLSTLCHTAVDTDVTVIGLGGTGIGVIEELTALDPSIRVVGLDAGSHVASGAAGGNGGFLLAGIHAFYHDAQRLLGKGLAAHIYHATLEEMKSFETFASRERPSCPAVRVTGSLRLAASHEEKLDCEAMYQALVADAFPVQQYWGREGSGLLLPRDGVFDPVRHHSDRAGALLQRAGDRVRLFGKAKVKPITHASSSVVVERAEDMHGECLVNTGAVVVAVDGKLELVLPELSPEVYTQRLQMLVTEPTADVRFDRPVYLRWGYDYWQQLEDGRIALGGGRDLLGTSERTLDDIPTMRGRLCLEQILRTGVRTSAAIQSTWAASVAYTTHGLPVVAKMIDGPRTNVWAVGAFNGTGNISGTVYGRELARKLLGRPAPLFDALSALRTVALAPQTHHSAIISSSTV